MMEFSDFQNHITRVMDRLPHWMKYFRKTNTLLVFANPRSIRTHNKTVELSCFLSIKLMFDFTIFSND